MASVYEIANLFLHLAEEQAKKQDGDMMTDLKLQKMLYFAQGWHLARHGIPLFVNRIEAWQHGPVVPDVYAEYKDYRDNPIHAKDVNYDAFSSAEMDTILDVFNFYGQYSAAGLRKLSHKHGSPWAQVYDPDIQHTEINQATMKDYFLAQKPLETFADRLRQRLNDTGIHVETPKVSERGNPILQADDYEDWGDWGDGD